MRKLALILPLLVSCCAHPAYAIQCGSTAEAMAYAAQHKLRPFLVRGAAMQPYIDAAKEHGIEISVQFVAIIQRPTGRIAFVGNFDKVCGLIEMSQEDEMLFARPA